MWGKKQFTVEEGQESRRISIARIHVERAIKYIKDYKIVQNKVNRKLLPHLSKIFFICGQLTNLEPVKLREIDATVASLAFK